MLTWLRMYQKEVLHSIRTAVAAVGSLLIARFCRLPESYWAAVTAIVIMQSTLGAAWTAPIAAPSAVPAKRCFETRDHQRTDRGDRRSDRMQHFFFIHA